MNERLRSLGYSCVEPLARLLVFLEIQPDHLTLVSLCVGVLSGGCAAYGHFGFAGAFLGISALLDMLDGSVARLSGTASDAGHALDTVVDRYVEFFFIGGLVLYYNHLPALMILCLLALLGSYMVSYLTMLARAKRVNLFAKQISMRRPERIICLVVGALLSPIIIPWLEFSRPYQIAVGYPMVIALALTAVLANLSALKLLSTIRRALVRGDSASTAISDPHRACS